MVLNNAPVRLRWNGSDRADAVTVEYRDPPAEFRAASHFGYGIATSTLPFLFHTRRDATCSPAVPSTRSRMRSVRSRASSRPTGRPPRLGELLSQARPRQSVAFSCHGVLFVHDRTEPR